MEVLWIFNLCSFGLSYENSNISSSLVIEASLALSTAIEPAFFPEFDLVSSVIEKNLSSSYYVLWCPIEFLVIPISLLFSFLLLPKIENRLSLPPLTRLLPLLDYSFCQVLFSFSKSMVYCWLLRGVFILRAPPAAPSFMTL